MNKYVPDMYVKKLQDINYEYIKKKGITSLIFDIDNTLATKNSKLPSEEIIKLLKELKNDFSIYIISNNISRKRVKNIASLFDIPYVKFAVKPLPFGFRFIKNKYGVPYNKMCMIGDQILTDVYGGNRLGIFTVLVEPLDDDELKITSFNRIIENKKIRKLSKMGLFERGKYYDGR